MVVALPTQTGGRSGAVACPRLLIAITLTLAVVAAFAIVDSALLGVFLHSDP